MLAAISQMAGCYGGFGQRFGIERFSVCRMGLAVGTSVDNGTGRQFQCSGFAVLFPCEIPLWLAGPGGLEVQPKCELALPWGIRL